ncbi:MAG: aminotransferase class I/II-fold pyridoxal phosphate-dependent enzyme [Spirochaetia bacterium]|nr:aminotransferase class I/II-fold pyridoxal phosphate-dependent enzyme [Spirochaetota bacterium]MCX8096811.1 aminotransferase class I/II-fold pyridoxal phosphate-dependent enzyme [Spirochaetota bacterium]MDW8112780.1 aminotransferase class I/II-fold pyridoxal phosphate-dependent enzyme [Spirochaetia bacterium]
MNIDKVKSFIVMDILEKALEMERYGVDIIHLEIGEPDLPTPQKALEKLPEYLSKYKMGYTPSLGIQQLRESISNYYFREYKVEIPPSNIVITPSSSTGMYLMVSLLLDGGGEFIVFDPSYPCYPNFILHSGGEVVRVNVFKENNFNPDISDLKKVINSRTKGLITSSPSNPTGTLLKDDILEVLLETGLPIIVDEIYQGIVFTKPKSESSVARYFTRDGNLIISNGFSKYFSMPGWRVGWLVLPDRYIPNMQKLLQNIVISTPTPSQVLASICISECIDILDEYTSTYHQRFISAKQYLERFGFSIGYEVEGAFYIYLDMSKYTNDSYEFSKRFLEEYSVAITPGIDFGQNMTNKFVRISLTNRLENILVGLERLINMIYGYHPNPRPV